ncbi:receptor-like protein kinase 5 [Papaver somniferum]|uniref:receptor-like protein kinase 5 n=1 Tax=Papaver somniferum TaxID=3469 RepID=UPI000E6FA861|nr:receptor-like protein kinase 5 [Papaver somniferum]
MNELTGSIPEGFGEWKNLTSLVMYRNRLSGKIPASIGLLPLLTDIRLFVNDLTGELPTELGLHSKLVYLEVNDNKLSGKLPENLCFGGEFYGISAFSNKFTGELPKSFAVCPSLTHVMLYKNMLGGEVPASFWSPVNLSYVQIHDNMFSGDLPDKLSSSLKRLEIENNRFTGRIPLDIASSAQLVVFDGSNNLFTSEIPTGLTALSLLTSLSLDGNEISGSIPSDIMSWKSLNTLTLSRNQISGEIPSKIGLLPSLTKLDLSENQISGSVPLEMGNLKLNFLNLSSNLLSGKIPSQLENLAFEDSFLNNSGLCSNVGISNLMSCNSLSSRSSRKLSPKFIVLIVIVVVVVMILLSVILVLVAIRSIHKRKEDDEEDSTTWQAIQFQRLVDFTELQILSGLIKSNLIGSGGCGEVYKVSINHPDKFVAVKKISSKGKVDSKHATQFQAEVEILGNIKHNNIVKLMGYMSSKYTKLLVYEYMDNGSLDQWLHQRNIGNLKQRRTLDWQKRFNIAVGVAQGLSYIHHNCSPPIIHRDVKSSNILLDSEFKAKVADFGLAKIVQAGEPFSASIVAGTFGYIAPEYGRTLKVNEKVDVYSFGVVLLELVTGRKASKGDEDRSLAEWASDRSLETSLDLLLDEEVKEGWKMAEMTSVFRLGLMCTSTSPSNRPTMSEALQYLVRRSSSQEVHKKKALVAADNVAPLLLSTHLRTSNIGA